MSRLALSSEMEANVCGFESLSLGLIPQIAFVCVLCNESTSDLALCLLPFSGFIARAGLVPLRPGPVHIVS